MRKWYADCVAADGTAVVFYWARLSWGLLRLKYAAVLLRRGDALSEAATLRAGDEPRTATDGSIAWQCAKLGAAGDWHPLDSPVHRTLLASSEGSVEWSCQLPRGRGRISLPDGDMIEGLGYVERLDLTLRPWRLPIRELRWGRFLSDHSGVIWIGWQGTRPLTFLSVNSEEMGEAKLGNATLTWSTGRLELEPGSILREGALRETALARIPLLKALAPRSVREMHEVKRVRPGRLVKTDGRIETGWAIDETVYFGEQS